MAKRKRDDVGEASKQQNGKSKRQGAVTAATSSPAAFPTTIQIITGSYERVLHGVTATIPSNAFDVSSTNTSDVKFADTFLFNAHASAIRCLALSPPSASSDAQAEKVILASGSSDERINLYQLSATPPKAGAKPALPSLVGNTVTENPKNRELGSLLHHSSSISGLYFPTHSKLMSSSEDNTIAISRTRDWTVLSTIKAPIPKPVGRPSGDTAAPGEVPAGINDFAVHPSMKLMVSVSKGERCMRLWNLVTGKKAGVLSFEKELLQQVGEGRHSSGEGRRVEWDAEGDEFVVGFERGAVVYGMGSKPRARILPTPITKIHQMHYVPDTEMNVLAVSTEDGRILFFPTAPVHDKPSETRLVPGCTAIAQLGGMAVGLSGRVKDFEILRPPWKEEPANTHFFIITGSSDGAIRVWLMSVDDLFPSAEESTAQQEPSETNTTSNQPPINGIAAAKQVARLLATYESGNRITCLKSFIMTGTDQETGTGEADGIEDGGNSSSSSDDSE